MVLGGKIIGVFTPILPKILPSALVSVIPGRSFTNNQECHTAPLYIKYRNESKRELPFDYIMRPRAT